MNLCKYVVIVFATIFNIAVAQTLPAKQYKVGTVIKTSKGFNFERYQDPVSKAWGWKDLTLDGKIWFDAIQTGIGPQAAFKFCQKISGQTLPTGHRLKGEDTGHGPYPYKEDSDFAIAEKHGLREIFKDMKYLFFWSQSLRSFESNYGYYYFFNGTNGTIYYGNDEINDDNFAARCVSDLKRKIL